MCGPPILLGSWRTPQMLFDMVEHTHSMRSLISEEQVQSLNRLFVC